MVYYIHKRNGGFNMGTISDKNTRTALTISKELKKELEQIAKEQNRSLNNLMITVLKNYVDSTR